MFGGPPKISARTQDSDKQQCEPRQGASIPARTHPRNNLAQFAQFQLRAKRVTSAEGGEEFLSMGTIVVSNGLLPEQILRVLRERDAAPLPQ
jgi:hypothetical protein